MTTLLNWSLSSGSKNNIVARGFSKDDTIVMDGIYVVTSSVNCFSYTDAGIVVATNEKDYLLPLGYQDILRFDNTSAILAKVTVNGLGNVDLATALSMAVSDMLSIKMKKAENILSRYEVYAEFLGETCLFACYLDGDEKIHLFQQRRKVLNYFAYQSTLIALSKELTQISFNTCDEYATHVWTYGWSDNIYAIKVENIGSIGFTLQHDEVKAECLPQQITKIKLIMK